MSQADNIVGHGQHGRGPGPEVMGASTLTGDTVVDAGGEPLGKILEIMLDVPSGRIAYVVLSVQEQTAAGAKLFAVPWPALTLDSDRRRFILDVNRERLKQAPGLDPEHWPTMAQPTWASTLYEFYGVEPDWH
ncbi:MAG TPA: PRC-barrel domain-containing protein [Steroidobacteraceae bacterium]|jgi:sporulation protein YlmC with PRC-barrel domain|nr:PRC-barrel domain-containing protein [Steroidobacteraceae bacterium]